MAANNYSQTIARELVHKRAVAEVLVTSVADHPTGWTVHAQLPRLHSFHADAVGQQCAYHDPLLVMEAFRQGCIAASHLFYDVPLDAHHTVRYYQLSVLDSATLEYGAQALDLQFNVTVRKEFRRGDDGPVQGLDVVAVAAHDGAKAMELSGAFGWMSDAKWQQFRAGSCWDPGPQPTPADPGIVGRTQVGNVVIGEPVSDDGGAFSAPVVVDVCHPTLFDHPLDHLPGGLIIEACRQLSLATLGSRASAVVGPSWLRCDFHSFSEMDAISTAAVTVAADDPLSFRAAVSQTGQTRATVELTFVLGGTGDELPSPR